MAAMMDSSSRESRRADATKLPGAADVWRAVMVMCDLWEVLALERTCRLFHELASDRQLWLHLLRSLDQHRAPALPRHVRASTLPKPSLRKLVVGAYRRFERAFGSLTQRDCGATDVDEKTGDEDAKSEFDRLEKSRGGRRKFFAREEIVNLNFSLPLGRSASASEFDPESQAESDSTSNSSAADAALLRPLGAWGTECLLLPGGAYILVRWPVGYLQCFTTPSGAASKGAGKQSGLLWTYPHLPTQAQLSAGAEQPLLVNAFAAELASVQNAMTGEEEEEMRVLVLSELNENEAESRKLEVLKFNLSSGQLSCVYVDQPPELDVWHGLALCARLRGSVLVVYTEGYMHVAFWEKCHSIVIKDCFIDCLEIVDDYIICVRGAFDGNILTAIPLEALESLSSSSNPSNLNTFSSNNSDFPHPPLSSRLEVPKLHAEVRLAELPTISAQLTVPAQWLLGRAMMSICEFHWKEGEKNYGERHEDRTKRDIAITVLLSVYSVSESCDFPISDFFVLKRRRNIFDDENDAASSSIFGDGSSERPNLTIRADQEPPRRAKLRRQHRTFSSQSSNFSGPRFVRIGRSCMPGELPSIFTNVCFSSFDPFQTIVFPSTSTSASASILADEPAFPPSLRITPPSPASPELLSVPLPASPSSLASIETIHPTPIATPSVMSPSRYSSAPSFNPSSYSLMAPPSQSGIACLAFHDDHNQEYARYVRSLALFAAGVGSESDSVESDTSSMATPASTNNRHSIPPAEEEIESKTASPTIRFYPLEDALLTGAEGWRPATYSLNVEHYSSAVYYLTEDMRRVVIKYLE